MKSLKFATISLILTFSILFSSIVPVGAANVCRHNYYTDTYSTSEYTGEFTKSQHEVRHYYDRVCTSCGELIGIPTTTQWVAHRMNDDECECGYEESCNHPWYTDTYTTSDYTGKYTQRQHEVRHYYDRECTNCGEYLREVTTTEWVNHRMNDDECECGYEESCNHSRYKDKYVTSEYTGDYTQRQHEVKHYYDRKCSDCGEYLDEVTTTEWVNHQLNAGKCICGYVVPKCSHSNYTDVYVTSEHTGEYTKSQHEVKHYYNRKCNACGEELDEITTTEWVAHRMNGDECECGYEKSCNHPRHTDTYVTSEYTGEYTKSQHEVKHYYNRKCNACGEKLDEITTTEWVAHRMNGDECECGYKVVKCSHSNYTDVYVTSEHTGEYTKSQHEVKHYYNRKCNACDEKLDEVTTTEWVAHRMNDDECECGYEESCNHPKHTDTYVTSEYTGEYTESQHEVKHYYDRKCSTCGEKFDEVTAMQWVTHRMNGDECECGYEVAKCNHNNYSDIYVTSKYTGEFTENQHEVKHYYDRKCSICGEKLDTTTENVWIAHCMKENKCECGHLVSECSHIEYIDTYTKSKYTGEYTTNQHEVIHYYKRECRECGKKLSESSETVWITHHTNNNKCVCGYQISPNQEDVTSAITVKFDVEVDNRIKQLNTLINEIIPKAYSNGTITLEERDNLLNDIGNTLNEYSEVKAGKKTLQNVNELQKDYLAKCGSESPFVLQLQKQLMILNYTSQKETGIYDDVTYNNVLYFQLVNDLKLSGWIDQQTANLINAQSNQVIENYEKPYGKITNLKTTRYDIQKGYELKIECNSAVKRAYIQLMNPRDTNKAMGAQQFEADLETRIAKIFIDAKCTYDCYLYLIGENNETIKIHQGTIEFRDLPSRGGITINLLLGMKDAFVDAIVGIGGIIEITVSSVGQGVKNIYYQITDQQDKKEATQLGQLFSFITKAMLPSSEENKLLDQMLQETFGNLLYEALNSTTEERQRVIGYVIGDVLFGYLLGVGIAKAADKVGDFAKVAKGAIEITDDTINIKGKYVDDIAKYADDIAKPVDNIVKHLDDYKVIANKFPDEALPADGRIYSSVIKNGKIVGPSGLKEADFVIKKNGEIVIGFRHAFLANGDDVLAAGHLTFDGKGKVKLITNKSGHYRPTVEEAMQFEDIFKELGVDLSNTKINYYTFKTDNSGDIVESVLTVNQKIIE